MTTVAKSASLATVAHRKLFDIVLLGLTILAIWQVSYWILGDIALASPGETVRTLWALLHTEKFWGDISETITAMVVASLIAVASGASLGIILGIYRRSGEIAEPMLATLYSLPKVTLYPVVLLVFGLGISARIAFGVMHGIIPIALFAMNAIRNIRPVVLRSAMVMNLSKTQTMTTIIIPAALPGIMTGVRIGVSTTLLGVLIGEMFAAKKGLGFRLMSAIDNQDIPAILAVALLLSLFALAVNALLLVLDHRIHRRV